MSNRNISRIRKLAQSNFSSITPFAEDLNRKSVVVNDLVSELYSLLKNLEDSAYDASVLSRDVLLQASQPDKYDVGYVSNESLDDQLAQAEQRYREAQDDLTTMQYLISEALEA